MIRIFTFFLMVSPAMADPVVITHVKATQAGDAWRFDVTLLHPDTGWDHYADAWEVLDADGNSLGIRVLGHPHVNEQPFTRSLSGVVIPQGTSEVFVRARCLVDGWNSDVSRVALTQ